DDSGGAGGSDLSGRHQAGDRSQSDFVGGDTMIPGEIIVEEGEIELNAGREAITVVVANTGDRPIQVGSHYHFFETNSALSFDRNLARGYRLDIPAGT